MNKYKDWEVYEVLPIGWKVDNHCGSPLHGFDFCTNGKSILNGGKRALVRSIRKGTPRTIRTTNDECSTSALFVTNRCYVLGGLSALNLI
jgi:hypothetical protein